MAVITGGVPGPEETDLCRVDIRLDPPPSPPGRTAPRTPVPMDVAGASWTATATRTSWWATAIPTAPSSVTSWRRSRNRPTSGNPGRDAATPSSRRGSCQRTDTYPMPTPSGWGMVAYGGRMTPAQGSRPWSAGHGCQPHPTTQHPFHVGRPVVRSSPTRGPHLEPVPGQPGPARAGLVLVVPDRLGPLG